MANIDPDVTCANCNHKASAHNNTSEGDNTGACTETGCECSAVVSPSDDPAPADSSGGGGEASTTPETVAEFMTRNGLTAETLRAQLEEMTPAAAAAPTGAGGQPFEMPIMVLEGVETGDGRYIDSGVLTNRELPMPVMGLMKTTGGHQEAELVGRIDSIERQDVSSMTNPKTNAPYGTGVQALVGKGVFAPRPQADDVYSMVKDGFIRGVSVDLGDVESVLEFVDEDGNVVDDENPFLDLFFWAEHGEPMGKKDKAADKNEDEEEPKLHFRERMTAARMMGVTICPFPAFESAYIKLPDGTETPTGTAAAANLDPIVASMQAHYPGLRIVDEPWERDCEPCKSGAITASNAPAPMYPPSAWFNMPEPDALTPMTITDDGRIFGHVAGWQTCHASMQNQCLLAPRSSTEYASYQPGAIKTAEGDVLSVGHITLGTGHADLSLDLNAAMEHYDNTGTVAASVVASNGKHGVWVCGTLEPDLSEIQIRRLRGSALSGDWRPHGRGLELIAVLAVNTPGYLVPRARVASGRPMALVAAGMLQAEELEEKRSDPAFTNFMEYVLEKDAAAFRERIKKQHEEAEARATALAEKEASLLRSRIHAS